MRKHVFLSGIMAVLLLGVGLAAYNKMNDRTVGQTFEEGWTEPVFAAGAGNALAKVRNPKNLQAIVDYADTIIAGVIVSINDTSKSFTMREGTPERAVSEQSGGGSTFTVNGRDIVIAVSDKLKGKLEGSEVKLNIYNVDVSLDPELKRGESYIFFLKRDEANGKYSAAHFSAGYIKIDKDHDRVHPLYVEAPDFSELDNQPFEQVKKKIKEKVK